MKMSIGGRPAEACDKTVIEIVNPATGKVIDTVPNAGPQDVAIAVKIAKAAQKQWAKVPVH